MVSVSPLYLTITTFLEGGFPWLNKVVIVK